MPSISYAFWAKVTVPPLGGGTSGGGGGSPPQHFGFMANCPQHQTNSPTPNPPPCPFSSTKAHTPSPLPQPPSRPTGPTPPACEHCLVAVDGGVEVKCQKFKWRCFPRSPCNTLGEHEHFGGPQSARTAIHFVHGVPKTGQIRCVVVALSLSRDQWIGMGWPLPSIACTVSMWLVSWAKRV